MNVDFIMSIKAYIHQSLTFSKQGFAGFWIQHMEKLATDCSKISELKQKS